ncbi:hypothetical protein AB0K14_00280 [Actinosynnema sp. NPDC050801]|uniref:hypothetical protein n=1 Tax=unclassified Actinosynnema TaxID=2637065 RepID=UPI0033C6B66F
MIDWMWFIGGYVLFTSALALYAAHVAISGRSAKQREDAFKVLKLVWRTATGAGGALALIVRAYEVGLM